MALLTTYFDPFSLLSPKSPNFAVKIVVFCSKRTDPVIIDAHCAKTFFYTTWVLRVAYQKQLLWPKLMGVWARGSCKNLGPTIYFLQPLKLTTSNLVYNLGLGSSLPRNNFYDQNWRSSGLGEYQKKSKKIGTPVFIFAAIEASKLQ